MSKAEGSGERLCNKRFWIRANKNPMDAGNKNPLPNFFLAHPLSLLSIMVADTSSAVSAQHAEDIAFARAMHGKEIKTGLLSNLASKNADVHNVATDTYLKMWKQPEAEDEQDENKRLDSYTALVNSYYNLATDFYEYGE